jgi:RNA polymerase sigma-70 factor (ECF subfamily)
MKEELEARWRNWMVAAQAGDAPSYEKLLRELIPYLRRFVQRRLLDSNASEDVVQNILTSIHRARHTYRGERPFRPWLHAIARNAIIDYTRIRARRSAREISLESDGVAEPSVEAVEPTDSQLPQELEEALQALSDKQRQAVELIHLRGLSVAEAAAHAGTSVAALKVRAHRGYRAMRVHLEATYTEEFGQ